MPKRLAGFTGVVLAFAVSVTPADATGLAGDPGPSIRPAIVALPASEPPRLILQRRETRIPRWPPRLVAGAALQVRAGAPPAVLAAIRARTRAVAASERAKTSAGVRQWTERIGSRPPPSLAHPGKTGA